MKVSTTIIFWCLGNKRLASGAVVTLAKGSSYLALRDASSDAIRYLRGGVRCLIGGGKGSYNFETGSEEFCGTVDEDATSS